MFSETLKDLFWLYDMVNWVMEMTELNLMYVLTSIVIYLDIICLCRSTIV